MTARSPKPVDRQPGDDDVYDGQTMGSLIDSIAFEETAPKPDGARKAQHELLDVLLEGATVDPRKSQSPLERKMFDAFCACGYFSTDIDDAHSRTLIYQQPAIRTRHGVLHPDYAAVRRLEKRSVRVAIELDGHEFHHATKEQVERDYQRGREMARAGWIVVRFTGSEVWRDARACALEVAGIVIEAINRIAEGR